MPAAAAIAPVLALIGAVRARLSRRKARRQRRKRNVERQLRLEYVGADGELAWLVELSDFVAEHAWTSTFDLEGLLDRYVELAIARERCLDAIRRADPDKLEERLASARLFDARNASVIERRLVHARSLQARALQLDDSLADIAELVCCYAERVSAPSSDPRLEVDLVADALDRIDASSELDAEIHGTISIDAKSC
jgi:hypothetical protein